MSQDKSRIILITGASSGLGRAAAEHLASLGHRVFGASRNPTPEARPYEAVAMDVTDDESVARGVAAIVEAAGRIDVLINNAGIGIAASIEDTTMEEARWLIETNFFGALRMCRAVLPIMRAQGSGLIINTSSIGGLMGLPYQGLYSASKFAIEGLSEALRMEVAPFGIHVTLLEPGDFCTPFTANRRQSSAPEGSPYAATRERVLAVIEADETNGFAPEALGPLLARIIASPKPRLRYQAGSAEQKLAALLKRLLPGGLFEGILRDHYRVSPSKTPPAPPKRRSKAAG
jgi:NAD(P)-dependent dehydrogenase (short-subunit alcohol dehydrogenase family)